MARLQSAKHKPRQPDHPSPAYLLKSSNAIRQQRLSTEAITKTAVAAIDTDTDAGGAQPNHPRQRTGGQGQQSRRPTNWPRLTVAKAYQRFEDGTTFAPLPDDATDEDRRKRKRALEQKRDVVQAALHAGAETLPESARDAQKRLAWLRGQIYAEDALLKKEPIDSCHPCKRQRIELKRQSKTAVAASAAREYPPLVREERRAKQSQASEAGAPGAPRSNQDTRSRYGNSNGSPPTGHPPTWQQPTGAIDLLTLLSPKTRDGTVPCEEQILTQDDRRLRRAIDDQQGFRVYTAAPQVAAAGGSDEARREAYREFRALLAEAEPWKEEVFMLEIVAALQAMKILRKANFEIKLTKMLKSIPGGVLAYLHNANRRRQHGTS